MNREKIVSILPFIMWLGLLPFLWLTSWIGGIVYYFLSCFVAVYFVAVSVGIVKFVEKQSITERFGIQTARSAVLALLVFTSIAAVYAGGTADWNAFITMALAPVTEEVFFRGYMLGRFRNQRTLQSPKMTLGSVFLTSIVFAVSHIFRSYSPMDIFSGFLFGILTGAPYLLTGTVLLPAALHTGYNFSIAAKKEYASSTQFLFWIALIVVPSFLLLGAEWVKKNRKREVARTNLIA